MNEEEQKVADSLYAAMMQASTSTERAEQDRQFKIGASQIGHCSELVRRMLAQIEPAGDQDWLAAIMGTAVGDWIETHAVPLVWPDAITQSTVVTPLVGDERTYEITGHPDVIVPSLGLVLDNKGTGSMSVVKRIGPKPQQQFQRHIYAKGAWLAGMFGDMPLHEVRVGNVWHDRTAKERGLHVQIEPFSDDVLFEAACWLDEVVDAYLNGDEARKEPHYAFCEGYCPHFSDCRINDSSVEGLIEDPELLAAVDLLQEAKELESQAKRMKNHAQLALQGVEGSTGKWTVKWTLINGGSVSYQREAYQRLDVRRIK